MASQSRYEVEIGYFISLYQLNDSIIIQCRLGVECLRCHAHGKAHGQNYPEKILKRIGHSPCY